MKLNHHISLTLIAQLNIFSLYLLSCFQAASWIFMPRSCLSPHYEAAAGRPHLLSLEQTP